MNLIEQHIDHCKVFYELSTKGVLLCCIDGKIAYANQAALNKTLHNWVDMQSKKYWDIFPEGKTYFNNFCKDPSGVSKIICQSCRLKDGSTLECYTDMMVVTTLDNQDPCFMVVFDIENDNRVSTKFTNGVYGKFLQFYNSRNDEFCYVTNPNEGSLVFMSQSIESILGWRTVDFLKGGVPFVLSQVHPDDLARISEIHFKEVAKRNSEKYIHDDIPIEFFFRMRNAKGGYHFFHTQTYVLERDQDGNVKFYIGFFKDISQKETITQNLSVLNNITLDTRFVIFLYDKYLERLLFVSDNFKSETGISSHSLLSHSNEEIESYIKPSQKNKLLSIILQPNIADHFEVNCEMNIGGEKYEEFAATIRTKPYNVNNHSIYLGMLVKIRDSKEDFTRIADKFWKKLLKVPVFNKGMIETMVFNKVDCIDASQLRSKLTKRELEIISCISLGLSSKMICDKLHISKNTVDSHRKSIMKKLNTKNTADLVRLSVEYDLARISPFLGIDE